MPKPADLSLLREILDDGAIHIGCGIVNRTTLESDRSMLYVNFTLVPDNVEMVGRMSWESVGPDAGIFQFPQQNDLVLVGFVLGDEDQCFILKRLSSKEDTIPLQAVDGSTVVKSLSGKSAHLISDSSILLGRGGSDPTERLVLGEVLKAALSSMLGSIASHTHISAAPGSPSSPPSNAASFVALKASPVDDDGMLSDIAKTEK
jgi:hypothetical protein